ncbi:hypothetical protein GCM10017687_20650 [Streptomyces echinatus]
MTPDGGLHHATPTGAATSRRTLTPGQRLDPPSKDATSDTTLPDPTPGDPEMAPTASRPDRDSLNIPSASSPDSAARAPRSRLPPAPLPSRISRFVHPE